MSADDEERAADLHRRALVVNGLAGGKATIPGARGGRSEIAATMAAGGVTAANVTVSVSDGFAGALIKLSRLLDAVDRDPGATIARSADEIRAAKERGLAALVLGFQNADQIEGDLDKLDVFVRLGVRIVQLTYQRRNLIADGCGEPADAGLSLFGRELVRQLNASGVLIDLSHTGRTSTLEAIELSTSPVAITHACAHALTPHVRNKTDDVIRLLADHGGVFGVNAVARLVSRDGLTSGARLDELLDHVDHLVELVGVDHVGLGLDISEGMTAEDFASRRTTFLADYPELGGGDFAFEHYYTDGLTSMAGIGTITRGLVARGYADDDVLKILGGNFLRVFEQAWSPTAA